MVPPAPSPNDVAFVLPAAVTFLGEALAPVAKNLQRALARQARPSGHEFVTTDDLSQHMGVIAQALTHLSSRIDDLMVNVIKDKKAGMAEAYRGAGRLEQVLSEWVNGYQAVQASRAGPETTEARALLLGVYRHHMKAICEWLEELVQVFANPALALQRRGITLTDHVDLPITLTMTTPPEMEKLKNLVKRLQIAPEPVIEPAPEYQQPESRNPGILGTIGALAFGIGISKAVFGRHHG